MEEFAVYTEQAVPSCACGLVIPSLSSPLALSLSHPLSFPLQSAYCSTPTHAAGMKRERQMGGVRVEGWELKKEGR